MSTLFFQDPGSGTVGAQAAVDKVRDLLAAIKGTFVSAALWTVSGLVDVIESTTGDLTQSFTVLDRLDGGSGGVEWVPPACQVHLRAETGVILNAHRVRGHWYIPGCSETSSNGNVTGSIIANLPAAVPAFLAGSTPPLVWHRPVGPHGSIRLGSGVAITNLVLRPKFAVLRSRRD